MTLVDSLSDTTYRQQVKETLREIKFQYER